MPLCNDEAVVLRLSEYSETSQIVTLFTRATGQQRLIAKGLKRNTKKRVAVGLDLLEHGDVSYLPARAGADLATLTEWLQRDTFAGLRTSLPRLYSAMYLAELVVPLTQPDDPHESLFNTLVTALQRLSGAPSETRPNPQVVADACGPIVVRFQLDLLNAIGFTPQFRACAACQRPRIRGAPAWFSSSAGGLLCGECEPRQSEKHSIPAALVDTRLEQSPPLAWFTLFNYHLSHTAGRPFRLSPFVRRALTDDHASARV